VTAAEQVAMSSSAPGSPLLRITDLHATIRGRRREVHAVRGVSLDVAPGEALGLVGEPLTKRIVGYCDPLSAAPGDEVSFFVSCDPAITEFHAELVMPQAGAPGWEDVGPECTVVPADFTGSHPGRYQETYPGSNVEVPGAGAALGDGPVTVAVLVQPTCQPGTDQVVVSCGDPWAGSGFALILDKDLRPAVVTPDARAGREGSAGQVAGNSAGGSAIVSPLDPLPLGTWSTVVATLDDPGAVATADLMFGAVRTPGSRQIKAGVHRADGVARSAAWRGLGRRRRRTASHRSRRWRSLPGQPGLVGLLGRDQWLGSVGPRPVRTARHPAQHADARGARVALGRRRHELDRGARAVRRAALPR
jgi:hypothetical protein